MRGYGHGSATAAEKALQVMTVLIIIMNILKFLSAVELSLKKTKPFSLNKILKTLFCNYVT